MRVIFDNPAGAWALLGIPALLLIHTLQARSRRTRVSTLFLLDRLAPESRGGWRWEKLRSSLPLWLQLLAVFVLAWVLAGPRWVREDASQNVVVVLDSSLSMEASLAETREKLPARLKSLVPLAARTEWTLLETNMRNSTIFRGERLEDFSEKLAAWKPSLGAHDFAPALQLAASLVRGAGVVVFVTDHAAEASGGAAVLSFAEPAENCGFVGSSVETENAGPTWRALVRNHGTKARTLDWRLRAGDKETPAQALELSAGETRMIGGAFPAGIDRVTVSLSPDLFSPDNILPLVRPKEKPVRVALRVSEKVREVSAKILAGVSGIRNADTAGNADFVFETRTPVTATAANAPIARTARPTIIFPPDGAAAGAPLSGWVVADKNALVAGTSWEGLQCASAAGFSPAAEDTVLVWRGGTPLIFLRQEAPRPAAPVLFFNFDINKTNAARLPAFVVLIRRYIENCRAALPEFFAENTDTNQRVSLAYDPAKGALAAKSGDVPAVPLDAARASIFRAPATPGFFQVLQGAVVLFDGAAQFSDAREADLSHLAPADTLSARERAIAHAASAPDSWRLFWLMALVALPVLAWAAGRRKE